MQQAGRWLGRHPVAGRRLTFGYDELNRLTDFDPPGSTDVDYDYDAFGNRTEAGSVTYTYNDLNQLSSDSDGTAYTYDDAGRLVEKDDGTNDTTYSWSQLDELTQVDDGTATTSYSYDGLGRRSERTRLDYRDRALRRSL